MLRIAHAFNMANDGWSIVKGLRRLGVDAELIVAWPNYVASLPHWEEADIDPLKIGDLYFPNLEVLNAEWPLPSYVHLWVDRAAKLWHAVRRQGDRRFEVSANPQGSTSKPDPIAGMHEHEIPRLAKELARKALTRKPPLGVYDLVVGHVPFASWGNWYKRRYRKPYTVYDAGWIRFLHEKRYHEAQVGYRKAAKIFFTNVDTHGLFLKQGYPKEQLAYTPFAIDMDLYAPRRTSHDESSDPVFFMPCRPDPIKGKPLALRAFARYVERQPKSVMLLVEWSRIQAKRHYGTEYYVEKELIRSLGIEKNIRWLPVMNKQVLVDYYNLADATFDNFVAGAFGTTALEVLSCGKPLVGYADPSLWSLWHSSVPPVLQAHTEDEIFERMIELESGSVRKDYGHRGRRWIEENCDMKLVARHQLAVYEEVLRK